MAFKPLYTCLRVTLRKQLFFNYQKLHSHNIAFIKRQNRNERENYFLKPFHKVHVSIGISLEHGS
jgi:hypothetical protein